MTKTEGESEREASRISFRDASWLLFSDSSCSGGCSGLEMQNYSQKGRAGPAAPLARGRAFGSCPEVRYSVRRWFWPVQTGAPRQWSRGESRLLRPAAERPWDRVRSQDPSGEQSCSATSGAPVYTGSDPSSAHAQRPSLPEGAWQREAFSAPAPFSARSAGEELWVGVALSRVSWPGCSSRLTAASRRVPESSAGCGEVRAPEPPRASPPRTAGEGAGRPRSPRAATAGPRLPPGPACLPGLCAAGMPDP